MANQTHALDQTINGYEAKRFLNRAERIKFSSRKSPAKIRSAKRAREADIESSANPPPATDSANPRVAEPRTDNEEGIDLSRHGSLTQTKKLLIAALRLWEIKNRFYE